jgi:hypothetical protein
MAKKKARPAALTPGSRTVLQAVLDRGGATRAELEDGLFGTATPSQKRSLGTTLGVILSRGWLECPEAGSYAITDAGKDALKTEAG